MSSMKERGTVLLVHWDDLEAREIAAALAEHGWKVALWRPTMKLAEIKGNPPTAVVISLRRLPSHGREVADALWSSKGGRMIPIVFLDGAPSKVAAIRERFPTAHYAAWESLPDVLGGIAGAGSA